MKLIWNKRELRVKQILFDLNYYILPTSTSSVVFPAISQESLDPNFLQKKTDGVLLLASLGGSGTVLRLFAKCTKKFLTKLFPFELISFCRNAI